MGGEPSRTSALDDAHRKQKIAVLAHYDALTDLPNRGAVSSCALSKSSTDTIHPGTQQLTVMYIETIDEFKSVTDALGHWIGDELLRAIADRLALLPRARPNTRGTARR